MSTITLLLLEKNLSNVKILLLFFLVLISPLFTSVSATVQVKPHGPLMSTSNVILNPAAKILSPGSKKIYLFFSPLKISLS